MPSPWFSFASPDHYPGSEPRFYERAALPGVELLEAQWETIRDEVRAMLDRDRDIALTPYFDPRLVPTPGTWRTYSLFTHGLRHHERCRRLPATVALLERVPGLVSASLSWLAPQSEIKAHYGDTDAYVRAHLGLVIPGALPECGLEVGGEARGWTEGRLTLFCDAHEHRAWNHTDRPRLVMIIDVMRPETVARGGWYCAQVLSALALYKLGARASDVMPADSAITRLGTGAPHVRRAAQLAGALPFALYRAIQPRVSWLPPTR